MGWPRQYSFDGNLQGTELIINSDADSGTDEDPILTLLGGDGVAATNDDIVRSRLTQDSTEETLTFSMARNRNAAGFAALIGAFIFNGQISQTGLDLTINSDAAAATDEDPILTLLGGDGVAAPSDDLIRTRLTQDSTLEQCFFTMERNRNGAGYTDITPILNLGDGGNANAVLQFQGNSDTAKIQYTGASDVLSFENAASYTFGAALTPDADDGAALGTSALGFSDLFLAAGGVLGFGGNDVTVTHSANQLAIAGASFVTTTTGCTLTIGNNAVTRVDLRNDGTTMTLDSVDASDAATTGLMINTGVATTTTGGPYASGAITIITGDTDTSGASTSGNSGILTLSTGDALDTGAGTTGDSGNIVIETGASVDADTGSIVLQIGAAGGTAGFVQIPTLTGSSDVQTDASSNLVSVSDERAKVIHGPVDYGLAEVMALRPIRFNYLQDPEAAPSNIGFSAQNVGSVIPEAAPEHSDGQLGLNSRGILAALVLAVQELKRENDLLRGRLAA